MIYFNKIRTAGLAIIAMCVASQASADPATPFDWSGAYIGVQVGKGWSKPEWNAPDPIRVLGSLDGDGSLVGIRAGYDFQAGNFVYGIMAGISEADIDSYSPKLSNCNELMSFCGNKIDWIGNFSGRLGYAMNRGLLYTTGGIALANVSDYNAGQDNGPEPGHPYFEGSDNRVGWTVGGGFEYAVSEHISARIEYNYYDFGTKSEPLKYTDDPNYSTPGFDRSVTAQAVTVGIAYRF